MSDQEKSSYNVVFRYTKKAGGYEGVIFWTSYASKEDFQRNFTDEQREHHEPIAEGVTDEEAVRLTRRTPVESRVKAAIQEATDDEGVVDVDILDMQLKTAAFALAMDRIDMMKKNE